MNKVRPKLIEEVNEILEISEEKSYMELYELLYKYRSSLHPDKFLDNERKKLRKSSNQSVLY